MVINLNLTIKTDHHNLQFKIKGPRLWFAWCKSLFETIHLIQYIKDAMNADVVAVHNDDDGGNKDGEESTVLQ